MTYTKISQTNHWESKTRFYHIFCSMVNRCNNPNDKAFKTYYWMYWVKCEWETYEDFKKDMYNSYLKHCRKYWEKDTTIDRIDFSWNYCKENCRWATRKEQSRNKCNVRRYDWEWKRLSAIDIYEKEKPNVEYSTFRWRLKKWRPVRKALWIPNWREFED